MKRLITSLTILLLLLSAVEAQTVSQYEYWTDDNYDGRVTAETTGGDIMLSVSIEQQATGIHFLNFRALRSDGVWGNYCRYLYYIPTQNEAVAENAMVEYWIDDNYQAKATSQSTDATQTLSVSIEGLASGVHFFNCRAISDKGTYGNPVREMFYIPALQPAGNATLAAAEYWLDDDYDNKTMVETSDTQQSFSIDISHLRSGVHFFNYRAIDSEGHTGNFVRQMFYVARSIVDVAGNEPITYEYWIDDDTANKVTGEGTLSEYAFTIDVSNLEMGIHTFNFRAKNLFDQWGETFTVEFEISEVTVIDMEESEELLVSDVYDLSGKKVLIRATKTDMKTLPSGIYIFGKRKVLVPRDK